MRTEICICHQQCTQTGRSDCHFRRDRIELLSHEGHSNAILTFRKLQTHLEGNALLKAQIHLTKTISWIVLPMIPVWKWRPLNGAPGVYSARYAGDAHNSEANMKKLLQDMEGIENRKAQFRTVFALIIDGKEHLFEGIVKGEITKNRKGDFRLRLRSYIYSRRIYADFCRNGE